MNLNYFISPKMTEKGDNRKEYQKAYWAKYKGVKRRSQPRINLSDSEYKLFNQLVKKEGVSLSKLIKNMAIAYQQESFLLPQSQLDKLDEFVYLVRNIANNINQIAHHSNSIKSVVDDGRVFEHLKSMEDQVKAFITQPYKKGHADDN